MVLLFLEGRRNGATQLAALRVASLVQRASPYPHLCGRHQSLLGVTVSVTEHTALCGSAPQSTEVDRFWVLLIGNETVHLSAVLTARPFFPRGPPRAVSAQQRRVPGGPHPGPASRVAPCASCGHATAGAGESLCLCVRFLRWQAHLPVCLPSACLLA